jgi:hypothetical protein
MRVLDELVYAAENPDSLVGYDFAGTPRKPGRIYDLAAGGYLGIAPSPFPQLTLDLKATTVIHPNILITGSGRGDLIDSNNGYSSREIIHHNVKEFPLALRGGKLQIRAAARKVRVEAAAYIVANPNYASFLLGEIPRIRAYQKALGDGFKLVVHGEIRKFHRELLAMVGIGEKDLVGVPREESIDFERLTHTTPTYFHHSISYQSIGFLRSNLVRPPEPPLDGTPVYLSRSRLGEEQDRMVVNENEVEEMLSREGFDILHPQELTVAEQVRVFSRAAAVVSPFGATWANSVFRNGAGSSCVLATKFTPEFARIFQSLGIDLNVLHLQGQKYREGPSTSKTYRFVVSRESMELIRRFAGAGPARQRGR